MLRKFIVYNLSIVLVAGAIGYTLIQVLYSIGDGGTNYRQREFMYFFPLAWILLSNFLVSFVFLFCFLVKYKNIKLLIYLSSFLLRTYYYF